MNLIKQAFAKVSNSYYYGVLIVIQVSKISITIRKTSMLRMIHISQVISLRFYGQFSTTIYNSTIKIDPHKIYTLNLNNPK